MEATQASISAAKASRGEGGATPTTSEKSQKSGTVATASSSNTVVIDEKFSAIDFLKEFSRFPEQEYDLEFADKLFRRLVVSQDFTSLQDQEFLFVLSGLQTFIERVVCSKQRMLSLEDACFKLIMSYKDFNGKTFFTDKTMQNIFTGFVMYLTSLSSERLSDLFDEPYLRPHIIVPAISDLVKRQKPGKDLRFFTNPKYKLRFNKKKIDKCVSEILRYLEKNIALIEKYMERHKDGDLLFQMQVITLLKRMLTYHPEVVSKWVVHFCPRFVKNLGQDIDYNILIARSVTKLIHVSQFKPELLELISEGCEDLLKLIIRKFTWKSKYTFVSYDDKPSHEIELNPELFCVFISCSYSCCSLPGVGSQYLSLMNSRLEKLNSESLIKMLADNDTCLVDFLLRNLTFVVTKLYHPSSTGRLLPTNPDEAHRLFLATTGWSVQLIIDYLLGDETTFLEYFIKFLKFHEANCYSVERHNKSCCFAAHFEELLSRLTKMSDKNLIPYNADPLLNRLNRVLMVCTWKDETTLDETLWSTSSVPIGFESSLSPNSADCKKGYHDSRPEVNPLGDKADRKGTLRNHTREFSGKLSGETDDDLVNGYGVGCSNEKLSNSRLKILNPPLPKSGAIEQPTISSSYQSSTSYNDMTQ